MAVRSDVSVRWNRSPRLITVAAPSTDISIQDLHDTLRSLEEEPANLSYPFLISTTGKQDLGGGKFVGLTAQLQDARLAFQARTTPAEEGTATTATSPGPNTIDLIDNAAAFVTNAVEPGAIAINQETSASATVLSVTSETTLELDLLSGGSRDDWQLGDDYIVMNTVQCTVSGGNITAVDDLGAGIAPVFPTAFTQVTIEADTSAALLAPAQLDTVSLQIDELHQLAGLASGKPMTVTQNNRTVGTITLNLTGDGITTTTVTRQ